MDITIYSVTDPVTDQVYAFAEQEPWSAVYGDLLVETAVTLKEPLNQGVVDDAEQAMWVAGPGGFVRQEGRRAQAYVLAAVKEWSWGAVCEAVWRTLNPSIAGILYAEVLKRLYPTPADSAFFREHTVSG